MAGPLSPPSARPSREASHYSPRHSVAVLPRGTEHPCDPVRTLAFGRRPGAFGRDAVLSASLAVASQWTISQEEDSARQCVASQHFSIRGNLLRNPQFPGAVSMGKSGGFWHRHCSIMGEREGRSQE